MAKYFSTMEMALSVYWYITIVASFVFILLAIIPFIVGEDADVEADLSENPLHIISFRNIVNFLLGFGWTGVAFYHSFSNQVFLALAATGVGLVSVFLFLYVARSFFNNSLELKETIGKTGNVYLKIPQNKTGKGKILISIKGSLKELDAMTTEEKTIETGQTVEVIALDGSCLIVRSNQD